MTTSFGILQQLYGCLPFLLPFFNVPAYDITLKTTKENKVIQFVEDQSIVYFLPAYLMKLYLTAYMCSRTATHIVKWSKSVEEWCTLCVCKLCHVFDTRQLNRCMASAERSGASLLAFRTDLLTLRFALVGPVLYTTDVNNLSCQYMKFKKDSACRIKKLFLFYICLC